MDGEVGNVENIASSSVGLLVDTGTSESLQTPESVRQTVVPVVFEPQLVVNIGSYLQNPNATLVRNCILEGITGGVVRFGEDKNFVKIEIASWGVVCRQVRAGVWVKGPELKLEFLGWEASNHATVEIKAKDQPVIAAIGKEPPN